VPEPFVVIATQNPIETEGTYPLPEAQLDRFMMKVVVGYPSEDEEFVIVQRVTGPAVEVVPVTSAAEILAAQRAVRTLYIDPALIRHAAKLVHVTRNPELVGLKELRPMLQFGASPRATICLIEGARALAYLRGREYVLPQDVRDVTLDVLRHRVVLSYEAMAENLDADDILRRIMDRVPPPSRVLDHGRVSADA
jgi:MoxR-like ATPase